jgi:predicted nucleic acid-binding protein
MYLIDTVVLSELRKNQRDPGLKAWFDQQRTTELFVSVISIGEIERGIARQVVSPLQRADSAVRSAGSAAMGLIERNTGQRQR